MSHIGCGIRHTLKILSTDCRNHMPMAEIGWKDEPFDADRRT